MYPIAWELIRIVIGLVAVMAFVAVNVLVLVYAERKGSGHIQRRPGPFEVGPHGILQPLANSLKLIGKQLFTPKDADPILFWLAPVLAVCPVLLLSALFYALAQRRIGKDMAAV